ncbi:hypothetical protein HU200_040051 [Digitaria exilis]|uniref:Uncharacterized protein n=1 Tax=Digitaria exilis TaxID=1010633 RepID=A0A835EET5_9POAL|nr:hypothetical protein HU200_040051 [Digitaria exilis]
MSCDTFISTQQSSCSGHMLLDPDLCCVQIKDDVDMIERNKDEEAKRFQSHSIHFDFGLLVRIKECMVDLSSNCMELALKESEDAKETASVRSAGAPQVAGAPSRTLWRVFQLAFRVYNFAGGQDERADRLTAILAREIEAKTRAVARRPLKSNGQSQTVFPCRRTCSD